MSAWNRIHEMVEELPELFARHWRTLTVLIVTAFASSFICQNPFQSSIPVYEIGQISKENIRADQSIRVVDEDLSDKKREQASEQIVDVYDYDPTAKQADLDTTLKAFHLIEGRDSRQAEKFKKAFEDAIELQLSDDEWNLLRDSRLQQRIKVALVRIYKALADYWIVDDGTQPQKPEILVRDIHSGEEVRVNRKVYLKRLLTHSDLKDLLLNERRFNVINDLRFPAPIKEKVLTVAARLVDPDLVFNKLETEERQFDVRSKVEPIFAEIAQGEMILREGQRVDRERHLLLQGLHERDRGGTNFGSTVSLALLLVILMTAFYSIGRRNFRKFKLTMRDQWVMAVFLVCSLLFLDALQQLFIAAKPQSAIGGDFIYLMPFAFAGMTLRLFSSMEITTFFSVIFSVCVGWMLKSPYIGLMTFVIALEGAARMRHISQRVDVLQAGLRVGAIQALFVAVGIQLGFVDAPNWMSIFVALGFALISGLVCSAMILGIQPLLEYLGYTTDLRLMELSSTNHPLLKEMIIKAPGTYFHSFTVSQLAEKAAEAIHANALFARVASLYHDIGKIKKPHYFIENIKGENKHDKLVPTMSALIISNHVKDGIELAYEHKLPQSIVEIIPQHHGTALISYFYDKAKRQAGPEEVVDDHDFRYPGPKPQTREGAIILLADAVEATAKSLHQKSPEQLRQAVHMTIQRFFLDGQLNECDLSLKDLTGIGNAFLQVLQGVYHQRIDYPHLRTTNPQIQAVPAPVSGGSDHENPPAASGS